MSVEHLVKITDDTFFQGRDVLKMKRTKASKINQSVLAKAQREKLVDDLKINKFNIITDKSTAISTSQNLCITVRCADDEGVKSTFTSQNLCIMVRCADDEG